MDVSLSQAVPVGGGEHRFDVEFLPPAREHHKHLKSTNMLERLVEELKRRTPVVRVFPNEESCLRLVRALAVETRTGSRPYAISTWNPWRNKRKKDYEWQQWHD